MSKRGKIVDILRKLQRENPELNDEYDAAIRSKATKHQDKTFEEY
jgi:hypothetical protein